MKGLPARTQGIVASGLLAVLVLSVFASATYSGPESTIHELHYAVAAGDRESLKRVCLQDPRSATAQSLLEQVRQLLALNPEVRVTGVEHSGRRATVDVVYERPGQWAFGVRYYLQKPVSRWLVDTDTTWGAATRARF